MDNNWVRIHRIVSVLSILSWFVILLSIDKDWLKCFWMYLWFSFPPLSLQLILCWFIIITPAVIRVPKYLLQTNPNRLILYFDVAFHLLLWCCISLITFRLILYFDAFSTYLRLFTLCQPADILGLICMDLISLHKLNRLGDGTQPCLTTCLMCLKFLYCFQISTINFHIFNF